MSDETTPPPAPPAAETPGAKPNPNPSPGFGDVPHRGHGGLGGAIFGLWIVLIGVAFLLQNLGYFYIGQIWQFWPVVLIGLGLSRMLGGGNAHSRIWGLFMAGIGSVLLLSNMGYVTPHIWRYIWPFGIIVWGLMMMVGAPWRGARLEGRYRRRWERHQRRQYRKFGSPQFGNARFGNPWGQAGQGPAPSNPPQAGGPQGFGPWPGNMFGGFASSTSNMANRLHEYAILGGVRRRIDSQEFEGGDVTAVMGGVELDLRGAGTKLDEVVIEANALMGGVEISVPQDWEVVVQGVGILGGYDDGTHPSAAPPVSGAKRPRLIITGQALFGGVHVKN